MEIIHAHSKEDFIKCWEVMRELRPGLDLDRYLVLVLYMQDEGYKMIFIEEEGRVAAVCGYRYETMLYRGRSLYIDDLVSASWARRKGYASELLNYVLTEARETECDSVHLDSGFARTDAHRLYLNKGFTIKAFHFEIDTPSIQPDRL